MFSTTWGPTATLVEQDKAASQYATIKGSGVTVAVIDSGIDYNLAALGGGFGTGKKVVAGYDFVDNDADPIDTYGHGTEVASVIAANPFTYNNLQYSGVAPDAKLVALRVTNGEDGAADATIKKALDWVITNYQKYAISVINISLGSGSYTSDQTNDTLSADFATLKKLNIAVFAASGNSGNSTFGGSTGIAYPAADPSVISVGAVNSSDVISSFTQRDSDLDLLAPGEAVPAQSITGSVEAVDGTSFASPYAAGTAALLEQANPGIGRADLVSIMRESGTINFDGDSETGQTTATKYSRIDILSALKLSAARKTKSTNTVGASAVASDLAYDNEGDLYLAYYDPSIKSVRVAIQDSRGYWSSTQTIDTSGADVGVYVSIAIDSAGHPGVAYFDNTNSDLKYAHFNGTSWDVATLDRNKSVGQFPSLAYDGSGDPVISYYRKSGGDLKVQTQSAGGTWTKFDVDTTDNVGAWNSIAVDPNVGIVAVSYVDQTTGHVRYARYADSAWTILEVDDSISGAAYTSLNIHNDQAFISYQDLTNGDLKFAIRQNGEWDNETVYTPANTGSWSQLLFDSDDKAHIVFYSKSKRLAYQAVGSFGSWSVTKIGSGGNWLSAAENADGTSLAFADLINGKATLQIDDLL